MKTYFFNWEIRDKQGRLFKFSNSLVEAGENVPPTKVFNDTMADIFIELELPSDYHIRALAFNSV